MSCQEIFATSSATVTNYQRWMVDASLGVIAGNHVWFTKSHAENVMFYIGNTQQKMKNCQGQHLNDIKKLVLRGESLD